MGRNKAPPPAPAPAPAPAVGAVPRGTLIVDDEPMIRQIHTSVVEQAGETDIVTASDGVQALEKLAARRFALVLCDMQMPYMDGMEFIGRLRAAEAAAGDGRRAFAVLVSANADEPGCREACLAAGFDEVASKPISLAAVVRALKHARGDE